MKFIDRTGLRYGRLVVLRRASNARKKTRWECRCDCGATCYPHGSDLASGQHTSCGCFHRDRITKHGHTAASGFRSPTYSSWLAMMGRCNNPNAPKYRYYGGVGIAVCPHWREFPNFLADMGERPSGGTIDRIDNSKGYSPENCRWATREQQSRNQRRPGSSPARPRDAKGRYF